MSIGILFSRLIVATILFSRMIGRTFIRVCLSDATTNRLESSSENFVDGGFEGRSHAQVDEEIERRVENRAAVLRF